MKQKKLQQIFKLLYRHYGPQQWWPARSRLEIIVGAVLTQNTAWSNVEKAIARLRAHKFLSLKKLTTITIRQLAQVIRPAGYFNIKAKRLKNVVLFIQSRYGGSLRRMMCVDGKRLRNELLSINGIGPETADSIMLYAFDKPRFVIDAYTKRIFSRMGFCSEYDSYETVQKMFEDSVPRETKLFNEYHALIVLIAKEYCKKQKPLCKECFLRKHEYCRYS